jgi:hypothetical protein
MVTGMGLIWSGRFVMRGLWLFMRLLLSHWHLQWASIVSASPLLAGDVVHDFVWLPVETHSHSSVTYSAKGKSGFFDNLGVSSYTLSSAGE